MKHDDSAHFDHRNYPIHDDPALEPRVPAATDDEVLELGDLTRRSWVSTRPDYPRSHPHLDRNDRSVFLAVVVNGVEPGYS